jgi:hypothetical protein
MNKSFVLFNLREAQEELEHTIGELEKNRGYGEPEFSLAMWHLYHHVNTAWNARNSTKKRSDKCSDEDFNKWGRYPDDLEVMQVE